MVNIVIEIEKLNTLLEIQEMRARKPVITIFQRNGLQICNYFLYGIQRRDKKKPSLEALVIAPRTKKQRIVRKSRKSNRILTISKIHVCSNCMKLPAVLSFIELQERVYQLYRFPKYVLKIMDKALDLYFDGSTIPPKLEFDEVQKIKMLLASYEELMKKTSVPRKVTIEEKRLPYLYSGLGDKR